MHRWELRRAGYRSGGARRAVIELLGRQDCCLTAQEIFDDLRDERPDVGIASVYRVLELLTRKGLVQRIDVGAAAARTSPLYRAASTTITSSATAAARSRRSRTRSSSARCTRSRGARATSVAGHDVVLRGA